MLTLSDFLPYQTRGVEFLEQNPNVALWEEMGLGKTIVTATAFANMQQTFDARKMLVVGTVRIARDVWHAELQKWEQTRHLKVTRVLGTIEQRKAKLAEDADVYTISRDNFVWLTEQFVEGKKQILRWPWDTVVIDESSGFRSQSAKRWKAMRRIRRLFPRCIELTGTPSPNGYGNLWAQIYLLDKGQRLGKTETEYRQRWFDPPLFFEFGKWTLRAGAKEEIDAAVADIVMALRAEDYLTLPPVKYNRIPVRLNGRAYAQYQRLERTAILETFTGNKFKGVNAGVLAGKLLQFANGAMYTHDESRWELLHNEKLRALFELLEETEGPVLIAYNFKSDLERILTAMPSFCAPLRKTFGVLNTEASVAKWNAGNTDFLLLHPASAGHGLNLQTSGSETIIWWGLTYDQELYAQTNARLAGGHRRVGRHIVVHHLIAEGTIDEDVMTALISKTAMQDSLMKALSARAAGAASAALPRPE